MKIISVFGLIVIFISCSGKSTQNSLEPSLEIYNFCESYLTELETYNKTFMQDNNIVVGLYIEVTGDSSKYSLYPINKYEQLVAIGNPVNEFKVKNVSFYTYTSIHEKNVSHLPMTIKDSSFFKKNKKNWAINYEIPSWVLIKNKSSITLCKERCASSFYQILPKPVPPPLVAPFKN